MSTWGIEGNNPPVDFTKHVAALILDLFDTAVNWTETTVGYTNITFGEGAWTEYGDYAVDVRPLKIISAEADVLGSTSYEFQDSVKVHIFVRHATENAIPSQLQVIKSQIEKICAQKRITAGENIRYIGLPQWDFGGFEDNQETTWHETGTINLQYRKITTV